ncbi:MAG: arginine--tRNA ligase [Acidobacteria bacterium]|nr:arginine--tRNA ligase [Acidobacteriota bacterium]
MFLSLEKRLREAVAAHIRQTYQLDPPIVVESPKQAQFGELALPVCFTLAKELKRPPRKIAEEVAAAMPPVDGVAALEVAGAGYINVRFDRAAYAASLRKPKDSVTAAGEKIIVEHTNINPNKAAHIGHLRNAVLGDTLVRMLRALGKQVEVQNYIDNTGVQVADVVAAFHFVEQKSPAEVQAIVDDPSVRFDYLCWDLYARVSARYAAEPETKQWRASTLKAIEEDHGELAEMGRVVASAIVNRHLDTMLRLGIEYDVLPYESEILHLKFWAACFELLKQRGAIHLEQQGKLKGCWVMPASLFDEDHKEAEEGEEEGEFEQDKVIVRSDGTVTYVGKDIAYTLWKFGLLGRDFYYEPFRDYPSGHRVWRSVSVDPGAPTPSFGDGAGVFNVIDVRQSYLQDVVKAGLQALGYQNEAQRFVHFSYEMVALTPRCCAELGIELSDEDKRRPFVEVSGRKGLGVKADDLLDMLVRGALSEVSSRHTALPAEKQEEIARQIAVGALRYFMLRFTRTTVIAFDFQEALSFEGETGPYVQYAATRARNILRKLSERGEEIPDFAAELTDAALARQLESEDFWQLLLSASRMEWTIDRAIAAGEPAQLARYAFQVAQTFNNFYHQHHILNETDRERKVFLLWMTQFFLHELVTLMDVMGLPAPEVM